MSLMQAVDTIPVVAAVPTPAAPVPSTLSSSDLLKAATPAEDVDTEYAVRVFGDTSAVTMAKTIAPLGPRFDALVDVLESLPLAFTGQDPVTRQQRIAAARAEYMRTLPRNKAMSVDEVDGEVARRIDRAWQDQQRAVAEAVVGSLQEAHTAIAEAHARAVQTSRSVPDAYAINAVPALTADEQRALDPKSLLHSTDQLVGRQLVELRALRQDMTAIRSSIDEQTAATEIPRDTSVALLLRYAESGTSGALKRRADFLLDLVLDGSLPTPLPADVLPSALRQRVDDIRTARVPASIRQAHAAERALIDVMHAQVAKATVLLQNAMKHGFAPSGVFGLESAQRDADQRARLRTATSKAWAPVLKKAKT
ncbi:hypothetical protein LuPra_03365 [Luteitalea pratensis]|uniref:Uncharacterized protein n=1 Tax=Luteitalea pratensis TaxID=1855912 RepID=A0A143PNB4_LUTPR|nr:hypothetical protein [Luteitalea pratensis]AMY10137.1 hypothetical protein LuPra_03365 [Luteitalea pratensis]